MLLAGKPLLLLPLMLEQRLTADAVVRTGAGRRAAAGDGAGVREALDEMLTSERYGESARRFAAKYSDFDPAAQVSRMAGRVEELLRGGVGRAVGSSQFLNEPPRRSR